MMTIDKISKLGPKVKFAVTPVLFSDVATFYEGLNKFLADFERYGDGWLATKRNAHSVFDLFGSLPRQAAKQLQTPIQRERRLSYQKGQEKTEIFNLLLDGKGERAGDRVANWNKANPEAAIGMQEVSLRALIKHLERLAETKAGALGEKGSKDFRKALIAEKKEIRKKVGRQLTADEVKQMRQKIMLFNQKNHNK
jgi:acyl-coenzyme A synthetase/AMP-(fatty) acid ligase